MLEIKNLGEAANSMTFFYFATHHTLLWTFYFHTCILFAKRPTLWRFEKKNFLFRHILLSTFYFLLFVYIFLNGHILFAKRPTKWHSILSRIIFYFETNVDINCEASKAWFWITPSTCLAVKHQDYVKIKFQWILMNASSKITETKNVV